MNRFNSGLGRAVISIKVFKLYYTLHFQPPIPDPNNMRDFVSYPTAGNERLHCTMKRTEDNPEVGGPCYTLYLEYLGGLVPILKGRRISKLRPEFVIMDPKTDGKTGGISFGGFFIPVT